MAEYKVDDRVIVMSDAGKRIPAVVREERDWIDGMLLVEFAGGMDRYVDAAQILGFDQTVAARSEPID